MRLLAYFTPDIEEPLRNGISITCSDTSRSEDPLTIAKYKCNCRYPWLRELHALTTLMMSNSLLEKIFWATVISIAAGASIWNTSYIMSLYANHQTTTLIVYKPVKKLVYPTLVFCPKFVDALNYSGIWADMVPVLKGVDLQRREDLLIYVMAGSGFENVDVVETFSEEYLKQLDVLYNRWRGTRSTLEMFKFIFETNGIQCKELFKECYSGSATMDCCDIFEPTYVMLRGRCFRLQYPYYQQDVDETDKLNIYFWKPFTPLLGASQKRAQLVLYVGDENPEVGLYPRYYLGANDWNRLRMVQKKVSMLHETDRCSETPETQGKATCFVRRWLKNVVTDPLNCTLPYFSIILPYMHGIPICEPSTVMAAYDNITSTLNSNFNCKPACDRVENDLQITSTADASLHADYTFRIETSFNELEYMQYNEVRPTSLAGFISELGGQSGLFVGCSVITFVQLFQSIILFLVRIGGKAYHRYVSIPLSLYFKQEK